MKLEIEQDEVWPVYSLIAPYTFTENPIEISDELYSEYLEVQYKWKKIQKQLKEHYEEREKRIEASNISVRSNLSENIA